MKQISYAGYRFPPEVIDHAIWLYLRFTLSFRDVEDLLAERGITVSYETIRRWVNHFGLMDSRGLAQTPTQAPQDLAYGRSLSENRWPHGLPVASRRRRRRGPRSAGPSEKEQVRRTETHAKAFEEIRFHSRSVGHR